MRPVWRVTPDTTEPLARKPIIGNGVLHCSSSPRLVLAGAWIYIERTKRVNDFRWRQPVMRSCGSAIPASFKRGIHADSPNARAGAIYGPSRFVFMFSPSIQNLHSGARWSAPAQMHPLSQRSSLLARPICTRAHQDARTQSTRAGHRPSRGGRAAASPPPCGSPRFRQCLPVPSLFSFAGTAWVPCRADPSESLPTNSPPTP